MSDADDSTPNAPIAGHSPLGDSTNVMPFRPCAWPRLTGRWGAPIVVVVGYDFSFKRPGRDARSEFRLAGEDMSLMREVMREAGAATEPDADQALRAEGFEPTDASVPMKKFLSNDDWHVTPEECRFIAERVAKAAERGVVSELLSYWSDAPPEEEVDRLVADWVDYNRRAADHGGYRVR
jgi:hypothetical protein